MTAPVDEAAALAGAGPLNPERPALLIAGLARRHARPVRAPGGTPKAVRAGTHRLRTPEETIALATPFLATAGVSRIADITGLDHLGVPVFNSTRPDAAEHNLTVTCGKGITREAARASAMMEAIERYCGEQGDRHGFHGTIAEATQLSSVLHPTRLVLVRGHEWSEDVPLEWWPTHNLVDDRIVLVPAAAVFTPYKRRPRLIGGHSDGLAAGNSPLEATVHALYELVERDCTAFGETLRDAVRIDLTGLSGVARDVRDRLLSAGVEAHLFAFRNEIGIPTFYSILDDRVSRDPALITAGAGCHLDPHVGISRALTEAVQSRLSVISGGREDLARMASRRPPTYEEARRLLDPWTALPDTARPEDFEDLSSDTLEGDLDTLLDRVRRVSPGAVLVTELSRMEMPLSVCRVIVPGLEFFHEERDRIGPRLAVRLMGKVEENDA
ncbi:YcaO-like family protein [Streptomyces bauhiniae]